MRIATNFLDLIDTAAPNIPVYTLSGNHDMYSGGAPYYWLLTQLNATAALQPYRQKASYFCLRSANWQILAMDTGLHDCDPLNVDTNLTFLDPQEAAWHATSSPMPSGRQTICSLTISYSLPLAMELARDQRGNRSHIIRICIPLLLLTSITPLSGSGGTSTISNSLVRTLD